VRDLERIRVRLDDGVEDRVQHRDPVEVRLRELALDSSPARMSA
jgi:hypothetical protein